MQIPPLNNIMRGYASNLRFSGRSELLINRISDACTDTFEHTGNKIQGPLKSIDFSSIYRRMKLSDYDKEDGSILIKLSTDIVEKLFKEGEFYIQPGGSDSQELYNRFIKYLHTGKDIDVPTIRIFEKGDGYDIGFLDGRHRFSVLRDLGMPDMFFSVDKASAKTAKKFGLEGIQQI